MGETAHEPWDASLVLPGVEPRLVTPHGALFQGDCLDLLPLLAPGSVDLVFADPPFNLSKDYGGTFKDALGEDEYLVWSRAWLEGCVRALAPGGSLFLYNLPKWCIPLGAHLSSLGLDFRHWVSISSKSGFPIRGRLYPAHYGLLYYSKGRPKAFHRIRTPVELCRHCGGEIRDYGGHRHKLHPDGISLTDVWTDVPPVRHWKFKSRQRGANQLSTKVPWRAISMASDPGDVVLDPFGGSGTTYDVAESLGRRWVGMELEGHHCEIIEERLASSDIAHHEIADRVEG
jgi:site-specific DNA-methyltransferase (adenine-specific)